jgi:hypothetical protein
MSLHKQLLQRKIAKTEKLAKGIILHNGGVEKIFSIFKNKPSEEQLVTMVVASKYGPGEPLGQGGDEFALEYIIHEFNEELKERNRKPVTLNEKGSGMGFISSQSEKWANLLFTFYLDEEFIEYIAELNPDDFYELENFPSVYVDKESESLALQISCVPSIPVEDIYKEECFRELGIGTQWQPSFYPEKLKNNDRFFWYQVKISTLETICSEIDREKHSVVSHERHLNSGKIVIVGSHVRRNPIITKNSRINTEEVDYIVYRARDFEGVIRYYGEGKENRPKHVNSGVSHNYKINEHYFTKGAMQVEILKRGLSKQECLAIEKFLIKSHTGSSLWNIKDYEPDL